MIFTTPIKFFINTQSEPILCNSSEELLNWVENQSNEWNGFSQRVKSVSDTIPNASSYIVQNATHWLNFFNTISSISQTDDENQFRNIETQIQSLLQQCQMIWTGDILATKALAIADTDQSSAIWLYLLATGFVGPLLQSYGTQIHWSNFGRSLLFLSDPKTSASFHSKQSAAIRSIEKTINVANSELRVLNTAAVEAKANFDLINETTVDAFESLKSIVKDEAETQRKSFDDEWIKLRSTYDSQLKLSAPREYWQQKFVSHTKSSDDWRNAFF